MAHQRLGDVLIAAGIINQDQLQQALSLQKGTSDRLGAVLIKNGFITEPQLIEALQMQLGVEFVDLSNTVIPPEMAQVLSKNIAKKYNVVPYRLYKGTLYLVMSDPLNFMAIEEVKNATRAKVVPMISTIEGVERAIITLYGNEGAAKAIEEMKREVGETQQGAGAPSKINEDIQSAPTVRLVNSIIERAVTERASDIHLEPREDEMYVRMRVDGLLRNTLTVPRDLQSAVISRIKVMAALDIAERRVPQDGRANILVKQRYIDMRVSTLPTIHGEKMVIRLLDKDSGLLNKHSIGLSEAGLRQYDQMLQNHSGVVLIVGPTGSGKSSTMYSMIRELNSEQVNLVTLEDPVEYNIDGINQVQINEKTGMTFASGLRSILRQDPDIIAVGEIRDGETAEIAMRAAITGHLVLSTIHTNDALATIDRLLDIGVEPYLIAGALKGVISQRLVRKICPHCRREYAPSQEELSLLGLTSGAGLHFYQGVGCPNCFHTGYRGRRGVFEILTVDRSLRQAISERRSRSEIEKLLKSSSFTSLAASCRELVLQGQTTIEEAQRVINSADL